jgi:hypothetical protein
MLHKSYYSTLKPSQPVTILYYYIFKSSQPATILWGRMASCGRVVLGLPPPRPLGCGSVGQPILAGVPSGDGFQPTTAALMTREPREKAA